MQAKPVQIAVIVIGLLIGAVGIFLALSGGSGPNLADKMILVDVTNGETFSVSIRGRSVMLPSKNPETQQRTLFPIEKDENDQWSISSRYLSSLSDMENIAPVVNPENGIVDIPEDIKPKEIKK